MGVPIVLLPLLSSNPTESGEHSSNSAQDAVAKKPCYSSGASGQSGTGWGPPSLTRQAQTTPAQPSFPFPPRPIPFSAPVSKSTFTSPPTSPSSITHPLRMNIQSPNKTGSTSPPSSPTSPYPSSYSNRPSTTSTSAAYPYSSFHQRTQVQTQPRALWTPPSSLSHLMPSLPVKPREKPKFEFITLLDPGTGSSGPSPAVTSDGVEATEVGRPEVPLDSMSKLSSGLTEIERESERDHHDDEHDLEDHDQDHDLVSVTSSSSCPSLCTSSCPSCSASEVDTDHEHEIETGGRPHFLKGLSANSPMSSSFPSPFDLDVGLTLADEVERHKTIKKKPEPKKKERKFILVNDMEIELDDSGSESEEKEDLTASSGRITSTSTSTTREITTTTTTTTTSMEKTSTEKTTTTITTTTSSESPPSPRSVMAAPVPVKSTLWGSNPSSSASLITPPSTPPSEQISRFGNRGNKSLHSPLSSPSTGRGRMKKIGLVLPAGSSTSRERSESRDSDVNGTSPGLNAMAGMCLPVKFKSKPRNSGSPSVGACGGDGAGVIP